MKSGWEIVACCFAIIAAISSCAFLICSTKYCSLVNEQQAASAHIVELEQKIREHEVMINAHEDIMLTYQFFNEHWTKEMKGE